VLSARRAGYTLVELLVGLAVGALLMAIAVPEMREWRRRGEVRASADQLANVLRVARSEAIARNRTVVVFRTPAASCDTTSAVSGTATHVVLRTVPVAGETAQTLRCLQLADAGSPVAIAGPALFCLSPGGTVVANASPGLGAQTCDGTVVPQFDLSVAGSSVARRVRVLLSGGVLSCDPARAVSGVAGDGCRA
jgi:prepilin-type N-terminal cleavage/methylation domain-containing protein